MKILLTGTSGFIGSRLRDAARDRFGDENVFRVRSRRSDTDLGDIGIDLGRDGIDEDILRSIDVVIHAGAFIPKRSADANLIAECNGNIAFTEKLLSLSLPNARKLVYLSTVDVYQPQPFIDEESLTLPTTLYGWSKLYCEQVVRQAARTANRACVILRVGHVYGPGEEKFEKVLPQTIKKILHEGAVEIWGDGSDTRTYIHVDDVVTAVLKAVESDVGVEVVNLVGANRVSIQELIAQLILISKKDVDISRRPGGTKSQGCVYDNARVRSLLLESERDFATELSVEYEHIAGLSS